MKRFVLTFVTVAALGLAIPGLAPRLMAGEEKVAEKDVPKCVVDAVKKKYPKAELKSFSKEEEEKDKVKVTTYEVTIKDGERKIDIDLSAEGKILAEEETIKAEDAPENVRKALAASKYAKHAVKRVEKIVKEEKTENPAYEYVLESDDEKCEVVFDKDAKIIKEEAKKKKPAKKEGEKGEKGEKEEDDDD